MKMEKVIVFICAAMAMSMSSMAQEMVFDGKNANEIRNADVKRNLFVTHEIGKGRSGDGFRIVCPESYDNKPLTKSVFHPSRQLKIESTSKSVLIRVYVKGKGKGRLDMGVYDAMHKPLHKCTVHKKFEVNSPDKWTLLELSYTPKAGSLYSNKAGFLMPIIVLLPGGDLLLDDWSIKFADNNKNIVIED